MKEVKAGFESDVDKIVRWSEHFRNVSYETFYAIQVCSARLYFFDSGKQILIHVEHPPKGGAEPCKGFRPIRFTRALWLDGGVEILRGRVQILR